MAHGSTRLHVLHYSATLEPDIAGKSVKGTVRIRFATDSQEVELRQLGGRLDIKTSGAGTTVTASIPLTEVTAKDVNG